MCGRVHTFTCIRLTHSYILIYTYVCVYIYPCVSTQNPRDNWRGNAEGKLIVNVVLENPFTSRPICSAFDEVMGIGSVTVATE